MKSKLLLTIPCIATATIVPICSCNEGKTQAEKTVDAIFGPTKLEKTKLTKSFIESLKGLSNDELNNELIYDLFMMANTTYEPWGINKSMKDLYEDNKVAIKTNITSQELKFDNNELIANFIGYVSFVFTQDINDNFKKDDYVMITYDFKDLKPSIHDDYLGYSAGEGYSIGFAKLRFNAGQTERLYAIDGLNVTDFIFDNIPHNSKNWEK